MHILPSAEQNILSFLRHQKHERWGWVIYRCTYNDDEAWDRFKDFVDQQSRQFIAESDTPEIADSLEWTFIENRDTLDNASKDQLRAHFKKWAADAVYAENPRYEERQNATFGIPRYSFFIQVDEDSLRSVLNEASQPPGHYDKLHDDGYVNFVNAHWKSLLEHIPPNQLTGDLEEDIGGLHEPIDGCCEEDVGWMKLESMGLSAGFYDTMTGCPDIWYAYYERPPQIARI